MSARGKDARGGFTVVEVVIALMIFGVAITGLMGMSLLASEQLRVAADEDERWAVSQQKLEELVAQDTASLAAGSETIHGYPLTWTVTKGDPTKVLLIVSPNSGSPLGRTDTLVAYVDNIDDS